MASKHLSARIFRALFLLFLPGIFLIGCSPKEQDPIVARIGERSVPLSEYERIYLKSSGTREQAAASSIEEREKLLDLIVRYKLKLEDAYAQGLQKRPEVIQEIEQYKGSLAQSFLVEREVVRAGVRQLFERRQEEIRVSHILLELSPAASPAESAAAYAGAYELIDSLKAGVDFATLAARASKDPSAKENGGDLYYATGGDFVTPFEDAVYALRKGEICPTPVRTRFGLHVLKLVDRKPSEGEVHAAHIMVRFSSMTPAPEESTASYEKIRKVQDSLRAGFDFAELARRNSEDGGSAGKGGDLGWFSRRRWVRPFDDTVFTLQSGQISSIVRTQYGFHLIKCLDRRPPKTFEESKQELDAMYQQRKFADDNAAFMARLRRDVAFAKNDSVVALFCAAVDSNRTPRDSAWAPGLSADLGRAVMMTFRSGPVTVDSVATILKNRPDLQTTSLRMASLLSAIDKIAEQLIFTAKADELARVNPEFAAVMNEYTEGVLLYQVEQEQVWAKIAPTDTVLRVHFAANRDKFMFPERLRFTEMRFQNEARATEARQQLLAGATFAGLYAKDTLRMKLPSTFVSSFASGSSTLTRRVRATLDSIAAQMTADPALLVRFSAMPDTLKKKKANLALATKRNDALKKYLTKSRSIEADRIVLSPAPFGPDSTLTAGQRAERNRTVNAFVYGRTAVVISPPDTGLAAPALDERAKRADSLAVGEISLPFFYRNGQSIVRLDGREAPRRKTFEEAAPEVSTSFQDYEAKRLENEWIDQLKTRFPVVEEKEVLKSAFAPAK